MLIAPEIFEKLKQYNEDDNLKGAVNQDSKSIKAIYKELVKYKRLSVEFFKGSRESLLDFFSEYRKSSFRQLSEFNSNMIQKYKTKVEEMLQDTFGGIYYEIKTTAKGLFRLALIASALYAWFNKDDLIPDTSDIAEDFDILEKNVKYIYYTLDNKFRNLLNEEGGKIKNINNFLKTNKEAKKNFLKDISLHLKDFFQARLMNLYLDFPTELGRAISKNYFEVIYDKLSYLFAILNPAQESDRNKQLELDSEKKRIFFKNTKYFQFNNLVSSASVSFIENITPDREENTLDLKKLSEEEIKRNRLRYKTLGDKTNLKDDILKDIIFNKNKNSKILLSSDSVDFSKPIIFTNVSPEFSKRLHLHISLYTVYYNIIKASPYNRKNYEITKQSTLTDDELKIIFNILEVDKIGMAFKPHVYAALDLAKNNKALIEEVRLIVNEDKIDNTNIKNLLDRGIFNERFKSIIAVRGDEEFKKSLDTLEQIRKSGGYKSISEIKENNERIRANATEEEIKILDSLDDILDKASALTVENTVFKKTNSNTQLDNEKQLFLELNDNNDIGKLNENFSAFDKEEKDFLKDITNSIINKINISKTKNGLDFKTAFEKDYPSQLKSLVNNTVSSLSSFKIVVNNETVGKTSNTITVKKVDKVEKEIVSFFIERAKQTIELNDLEKEIISITDNIKNILNVNA